MSTKRESAGVWDIRTCTEVVMPPNSTAAYELWYQTAPKNEVAGWLRATQTVQIMELIIQNGVKRGLTSE